MRFKAAFVAGLVATLIYIPWVEAQQSPTAPGRRGGGVLGRGGGRGGLAQQIQDRLRGGAAGGGLGQRGGVAGGAPGAGRGGGGSGLGGGGGLQSQGDPNAPVQSVGGGGGSGVRITAPSEAFEPAKDHPIEYEEIPPIPDVELISLTGPQNVQQFLDTVVLVTGWNVIATQAVAQVQLPFFQLNGVPPTQAIKLLQDVDIYYTYNPDTNFLRVMTADEYLEETYGDLIEQEFKIEHAELEAVETVLDAYKSPKGMMMVDPRTSSVYVRDTRDNLNYMEKAVRSLDVPLEPRTFELVYVNADSVAETVETMMTEQGEMTIDPRTNQITITDQTINQNRIADFLERVDKKLETRTWTLNYAYADVIADQISLYLPEEMGLVTFDDEIHQMTVTAVPHRLDEIDALIEQWDKPRKQVQIEAYLLTASRNVTRNLGINWAYFTESGGDLISFQTGNAAPAFATPPGSGQNVSIGQLPWTRPLLNPVTGEPLEDIQGNPLLRDFRGSDVSVVIDYLDQQGDVTILAHPRVTVQDGQEALFDNTTQVPFSQSTADRPISNVDPGGGFNTTFRSISRIDFIDVGTILRVLPKITEAGDVLMEISAEDSSFVTVTVTGAGEENTVPQKTQNRVETIVSVDNQDTVVIGGLRSSNFSDSVEKLPLLGDIPLLGRLFKSTNRDHQHSELLIFITPTVVDTKTSPESAKLARLDSELAETIRRDEQSDFARIRGAVTDRKDEMWVSIGQRGDVLVDERFVTMDNLREVFFDVKNPLTLKVVVRKHPRAPQETVDQVMALAEEAGLNVAYEDTYSPFVPTLPSAPRPDAAEPQAGNRGIVVNEALPAPEP